MKMCRCRLPHAAGNPDQRRTAQLAARLRKHIPAQVPCLSSAVPAVESTAGHCAMLRISHRRHASCPHQALSSYNNSPFGCGKGHPTTVLVAHTVIRCPAVSAGAVWCKASPFLYFIFHLKALFHRYWSKRNTPSSKIQYQHLYHFAFYDSTRSTLQSLVIAHST
jgi:hypothetical protein